MPAFQDPRFTQAVELHKAGRFEEAARRYQKLTEDYPEDPDLWHFRGLLALHRGDAPDAVRLITLAIMLKPIPDYYLNLAIAHEAAGERDKAAIACNKMGNALQEQCRFVEAVDAYDKALLLFPGFVSATINRGAALNRLGRYHDAAEDFHEIIRRFPDPADGQTLLHVANAWSGIGEAERALGYYERLLALEPDNAPAHCSRALLLLRLGRLAEGWREYEWRWSRQGGYREPRGRFAQPVWQGESPDELGGPLLVIAEQGLGDVIQFVRYVPLLVALGHDVIFEALPELTALFADAFAHLPVRVVSRVDDPLEIEENQAFSAWVGVMSLPERFKTTSRTIPAAESYLVANPQRVEAWRRHLPQGGFKVGLAWAGNPKNLNDFARTIPSPLLLPLLKVRDADFYSLQKGAAGAFNFDAPNMTNLDGMLINLTETAAVIMNLDLVITVDTSIAHLAGALGRPVWLMIPTVPDWRWLDEGRGSPWYPTMRIFRQTVRGEWQDVIKAVGAELSRLAGAASSGDWNKRATFAT